MTTEEQIADLSAQLQQALLELKETRDDLQAAQEQLSSLSSLEERFQANIRFFVTIPTDHTTNLWYTKDNFSNKRKDSSFMEPKNLPTAMGWYSVELPGYRPGQGTYDFYEYDSLPPLPTELFTGTLDWLKTALEETSKSAEDLADEDALTEEDEEDADSSQDHEDAIQTRLQALKDQAKSLGLVLPTAFLMLMGSPELRNNIPSCTACEFQPVKTIFPHPGVEDGYIIRFLNDQQDVLLWYLYLTPAGDHCILVSYVLLEELSNGDYVEDPTLWDSAAIAKNTYVCALSFEEFIYRFWLENILWERLSFDTDLTSLTGEEQRYLSHYPPVA